MEEVHGMSCISRARRLGMQIFPSGTVVLAALPVALTGDLNEKNLSPSFPESGAARVTSRASSAARGFRFENARGIDPP